MADTPRSDPIPIPTHLNTTDDYAEALVYTDDSVSKYNDITIEDVHTYINNRRMGALRGGEEPPQPLAIKVGDLITWATRAYIREAREGFESEEEEAKARDDVCHNLNVLTEYYDDEATFPLQGELVQAVRHFADNYDGNFGTRMLHHLMEKVIKPTPPLCVTIVNTCMAKGQIEIVSDYIAKHNYKMYVKSVDNINPTAPVEYYVKLVNRNAKFISPSYNFHKI